MDGFAGDDPQALAWLKAGPSEKAFVAAGSGIGDFDAAANLGLTRGVANTQEPGWAGFLRGDEAPPEGGFRLGFSHSDLPYC
jgi:hypothetical protein